MPLKLRGGHVVSLQTAECLMGGLGAGRCMLHVCRYCNICIDVGKQKICTCNSTIMAYAMIWFCLDMESTSKLCAFNGEHGQASNFGGSNSQTQGAQDNMGMVQNVRPSLRFWSLN
jgi:hypothetical protein